MSSTPPSGPLSSVPAGRDPRRPWAPTPFMRLARTHAASVSGDALFAIGLAGSVFFSLDFNSARLRVALYLVLTIAPFAVAAPIIGPAIDRIKGGRRWIIVGSLFARALLCVLVVRHMDTLLFYPEAFGILVLQKVYSISKSAVVPGTVHSDEELVEANSKLTVLSALAVVVAAVPGGILLKLGGGEWAVGLGAIVFFVGTVLAFQLPPTSVADEPADEAEKEELRSAGIVLASSAMGVIRAIVGFLSFMLAFAIKEDGALWELGVVAVAAQLGFFLGAVAAPRVRRLLTEERILVGALVITAVVGAGTAVMGGLVGAAILSMTVGATGSAAKQAFDAIVQRDAPDANRGRSFAKFETRFQLGWVVGALIPIIIPISMPVGFAMIAVASVVAVTSYLMGQKGLRQGRMPVRRQRLGLLLRRRAQGFADGGDESTDPPPVAPPPPPPPPAASLGTTPAPRRAVAPDDPTLHGADPTSVFGAVPPSSAAGPEESASAPADGAPPAPSDPARRWMRDTGAPPAPPPMPGQMPLPLSDDADPTGVSTVPDVEGSDPSTPDQTAAEAPTRPDASSEPAHRRRGLLFEPEAWEDGTRPPAPDPSSG